jgi:hypothetical protein
MKPYPSKSVKLLQVHTKPADSVIQTGRLIFNRIILEPDFNI